MGLDDNAYRGLGRIERTVEEHDDQLSEHAVLIERLTGNAERRAGGITDIKARLDARDLAEAEQRKIDDANRHDDRRLIVTTALGAAALVIAAIGVLVQASGGF